MNTPTRDSRPATVLARIIKYAQDRGAILKSQDEAELSAILAGHASVTDQAVYAALANQFHVYTLLVQDVTDYTVPSASASLAQPQHAMVEGFATAVSIALAFAESKKLPMVVVDGNNNVRHLADEPSRSEGGYCVKVSFGELKDPQGSSILEIAEDENLVDAALLNLRTAYAAFTSALKQFRDEGKHTGSVLFLQDYEAQGGPILHREIV